MQSAILRRSLRFENLCRRELLAADLAIAASEVADGEGGCPWLDVNLDGSVTPIDALIPINALNTNGGAFAHDPFANPDRWLDVDFDGIITPKDALGVISFLNENGPGPFDPLWCIQPEMVVVEQRLVPNDTVVENQNDVTLLRFEAHANKEDQVLTGATFLAMLGDASNFEDFALWVDTDTDGAVDFILQDRVEAVGNTIGFHDIVGAGYVIPVGVDVRFELHGDGGSSFKDHSMKFGFAENPVEVEILDDGSPMDNVTVISTGGATEFSLVSQGDLYVTQSTTPVRPGYLLGGTLSQPVLHLDFRAQNEDVDVTYVGLNVDGAGQSIDRFELWRDGASVPFAIATRGAAGAAGLGDDFAAVMQSRQFVTPEGDDSGVQVRARIKADTNGGVLGEPIIVSAGTVQARGDVSSNALAQNDGDATAEGEVFVGVSTPGPDQPIVGTEHIVTMSQIVSVTNANPDPNGSAIPVGVSALGQFKFVAGAHNNFNNGSNDAVLKKLSFQFIATNIAFDPNGFGLFNKAHSTVVATDYVLSNVGGSTWQIVFDDLDSSLVNTEVDEGDDVTLVLQVNITNPLVNPAQTATAQVFQELADIDWLDRDGAGESLFSGLRLPETVVRSTTYHN